MRFAIDSICQGETIIPDLRATKSNSGVIDYVAQDQNAIGVIGARVGLVIKKVIRPIFPFLT